MQGAILLAGGNGLRMQKKTEDKLLHPIGKTNSFRMCCEAFLGVPKICYYAIAYRDEEQKQLLEKEFNRAVKKTLSSMIPFFIKGGNRRMDSVANCLGALPKECTYVHVHDCARPLIRTETISQVASSGEKIGALAVCRRVTDTVHQSLDTNFDSEEPKFTKTLNRHSLFLMETPQSAPRTWLEEGLQVAKERNIEITDEISLIELLRRKTRIYKLDYPNPKITHFDDFKLIKHLLDK